MLSLILRRHVGRIADSRAAWSRLLSTQAPSAPNPAQQQPQQISVEEAKSKAQKILDFFPGATPFRKATYATLTGGLTAFLVANGIYIPNDETLALVAFLLTSRFLYLKLAGPITNLLDESINEVCTKVSQQRVKEIEGVDHEIVQLEQLRDFAAVTETLFVTQRENILLEAQLAELVERQTFLSGLKAQLEEAVRRAEEKAAQEKRAYIDAIMAGVMKELQNPKLQETILKKSLVDLENMSPKAFQMNV